MKPKVPIIIFFFFCIGIVLEASAQCPMCKTALGTARDNGSNVGNSLNDGILYLLALPYLIAGIFGVLYLLNARKKKNSTHTRHASTV